MNFSNKAFTIIEALLGLILLSWMLSFYLPGLHQQLRIFQEVKQEVHVWELFSQCVQVEASSLSRNEKDALIEERLQVAEWSHNIQVASFHSRQYAYELVLSQGEVYTIECQAIDF